MESPHPPVPLTEHCSVIQDGILYVYSPEAFQQLELKEGGLWSKLENGVSVSGAACVKGTDVDGTQAMWVVGGRPANAATSPYSGLQKYSFGSKQWTSITPVVQVTKNRQNHAVSYLESSKSLLVYAGSQDGSNTPSIETFTIAAASPHTVESYTSKNQPVTYPVLLPWSNDTVAVMGGIMPNTQSNKEIYRFTTGSGWKKYPTKLDQTITSDSQSKNTLIQAADGSKVLTTFDLSTSPNTVRQVVLQRPNGSPSPDGQTIGDLQAQTQGHGQGKGGKSPRDISLTLQNWPVYNDTMAPTAPRSGFDLATDPSTGVVAITGGNPFNPVALFNEQKNTWIDTTTFFGPDSINQQPLVIPTPSSSPTPSQTPDATATASPTASSLPGDGNHSKTGVILGATLGTILGVIVLLILLLVYLRHRRTKQNKQNGQSDDEKQRLSFADRGAPYMMEEVNMTRNMHSHDSLAIMSGNLNSPYHKRNHTAGSVSSTARLVPRNNPPIVLHDAVEMSPIQEKGATLRVPGGGDGTASNTSSLLKPKRSSGWSRYFSGNEAAMAASGIRASNTPSDAATDARPDSARPKSRKSLKSWKSGHSSHGHSSMYAASVHDCNSHGPTEIPPLNLGQEFDGDRVSSSLSKDTKSAESGSARKRTDTLSSEISTIPPSTATGTIFSEELHDDTNQWTPITRSDWSARPRDTTTSSIYSHTPKDTVGISRIEPSRASSQAHPSLTRPPSGLNKPQAQQPVRTSHMSLFPKTTERQSVLNDRSSFYPDDNDDDVVIINTGTSPAQTAIPIPASIAMPITVKKASTPSPKPQGSGTDMSWVSLNA